MKSLFQSQGLALVASLTMGAGVWWLRLTLEPMVKDIVALPLLIVAGAGLYAVLVRLTMPTVVAHYVNRLPKRA